MEKVYRLTRGATFDEVDSDEQSTGASVPFPKGTEFRIFRDKHEWRTSVAGMHFYTVRIEGRDYNILAAVLERSMERATTD